MCIRDRSNKQHYFPETVKVLPRYIMSYRQNQFLIFIFLHPTGTVSQLDISRATGISQGSVHVVADSLESRGRLRVTRSGHRGSGKYDLPNHYEVLPIDEWL